MNFFVFASHEDAGHPDNMQLTNTQYSFASFEVLIHNKKSKEECLVLAFISLGYLKQPIDHFSPHSVGNLVPC